MSFFGAMNMTDKNPEYDVYLPIWDKAEPWFEFSEGQRQTFVGNTPWRMALADKKNRFMRKPAVVMPSSMSTLMP